MSDSFQFYYDTMIQSPDLTYRIVGVESTTGKPDKTKAAVILKDFIRDPLSISITHNYDQSAGGVSTLLTNLKTFWTQAGESYESAKGKWETFIQDLSGGTGTLSAEAYKRTVPWIDYFKTFSFTQVSIPLTFSARLYPKISGNTIVGVKDQVSRINEFFVGAGSEDKNKTGWTYYPPHGYSPAADSKSNSNSVPGTLTLLYGRFAVIENLILTNYQVTFSKELIRTGPSTSSNSGTYSPAYADVVVTLSPSTVITQSDIQTILASDYNATNTKLSDWLGVGTSRSYFEKYK